VLVLEPPRTRYDLRFRLAGFPVRVHPAFWLTGAILGFTGTEQFDAIELLLWMLVVFVSILVHELGHALAVRRCGWVSRIILYHLGGLATIESPRDPLFGEEEELPAGKKIAIAAAGPLAGFALAGIVIAGLYAAPIHFEVARSDVVGLGFSHDLDRSHYPRPVNELNAHLGVIRTFAKNPLSVDEEAEAEAALDEQANAKKRAEIERYHGAISKIADLTRTPIPRDASPAEVEQVASEAVARYARNRRIGSLIGDVLFVNIFWGLINLLPVFPLDGGQITRELFCLRHPRAGLEKTLLLSTIVAAVVGLAGLVHFLRVGSTSTGIFFGLMFGLLAFINYRVLQQLRAMGGPPEADDYGGYEPEEWWKR